MRAQLAMCLLLTARALWAGEITGRITLNDKPVAGVTVSALPLEVPVDEARREARRERRPEAIAKAATNENGEFRLVFETRPGEAGRIVSVMCLGGGIATSWVQGRFDTSEVDDAGEFAAQRGVALAGRILDVAGHPVPDAEVDHPKGPTSVRSGPDGTFVLEGVAESGNDLDVWLPGYAGERAVNIRGGRKDVTIVLKAAVPLSGLVVAADGTPAAGAVVTGVCKDARGWAETSAEGRFTFAACPAGRVKLFVDGGDRGAREATGLSLPRRAEEPLRLVLGPPRVLAGRVVDVATRRPIARAFLEAPGTPRPWTLSERDGSFRLRPAPPGDLRISAVAPGYTSAVWPVAAGDVAGKPVEVLLRRTASVFGRVVDEQRRPIGGARVRAFDPLKFAPGPQPLTLSSSDGSFKLRRIPVSETARLAALHPDFEPLSLADLGLKPGETRAGIVLVLRRGAVITGVVTAGGEPLTGVQVSISPGRLANGTPPRSLATPGWAWPRATTGADGRFRIAGLSPGEYSLNTVKAGWATEARDVSVAEGRGPDPFTIALEPEAVVLGRVKGKKGGDVAVQNISAQSVDSGAKTYGNARSAPDGSFRIEGLRKGVAYNLFIYGPGSNAPKATVTPPADNVEVVVDGMGRVAGRVVDPAGRPVTEYQVTVQADRSAGTPGAGNPARQDVASETGEFVIENATAGALEVRVVAKGYQVARVGGITLEEGGSRADVEVKLARGAALKGRVVEARGGTPVAGAEVSAESAPSRVTADSEGAFEFEGLAPGKVRVTATSPDFVAASETIEVGEAGATVELKMSPGASISAVVVTPGGEPVPGAEVSLAQGGQTWSSTRLVAGPDGRVKFPHLAPGRFTLTAGSAGRRSKPVDVAVEPDQALDDARVVIGGGATVLVTVTGLSQDERRQLNVFISGRGYLAGKELPDGRFEIRDVPSGLAQAYARVGNFGEATSRNGSRPVTVPEDGTVDVEIPFESGFTLTVHVVKDGQGVEGANVFARPVLAESATPGMGTTDASGVCRLAGLKPGAYSVNAYSFQTSGTAPEQKLELTGDRSLEFVLPSGRVAGRVVASGSRQPLGDARVSIKSSNADGTFAMTHDATTDDTGRFLLEGLEAGPLTLTAQRKGYVLESRSVTADGPEDVVIELVRGDGLDVAGRDGLLGTPLGSLWVRVLDGAGAEITSTTIRLDSAGRGEIPSLKPGSYSIVASGNGLAAAAFDGVPVPGPALAVSLTPGGTLDVDVPAERLKAAPFKCVVNGPRGTPLAIHTWGNRGELQIYQSAMHVTNFPPVSGTLTCPGAAPVPFTVIEGGTTRIAVK